MSARPKLSSLQRGLDLVAWGLAVVGYFGPWIEQASAALAWNAYDLFDILRVLPEIETLALQVNLYALRLPAVGLALLLPLLLAEARPLWRWGAALIGAGLLINTLPPYDVIRTAWRTPGWRVPFWWGVGGLLALAALTLWRPSRQGEARWRAWLTLGWMLLTGVPAFSTFPRLLPALERLFAAPVRPGWGFWACGAGWLIVIFRLWKQGIAPQRTIEEEKGIAMSAQEEAPEAAKIATVDLQQAQKVKERYERELLSKANVVGVGIGLRGTVTREGSVSVIVNVTHKVPLQALAPADRIPDELDGVPVKVEAIGTPAAQPAEPASPQGPASE